MKNKNLSKKNSQGLIKMIINGLLNQWAKHAVKEADELYDRKKHCKKSILMALLTAKKEIILMKEQLAMAMMTIKI